MSLLKIPLWYSGRRLTMSDPFRIVTGSGYEPFKDHCELENALIDYSFLMHTMSHDQFQSTIKYIDITTELKGKQRRYRIWFDGCIESPKWKRLPGPQDGITYDENGFY